MKKLLVLMLALLTLTSLVLLSACGGNDETTASTTTTGGTTTTTEDGAVITPPPSDTVTKTDTAVTVKSLGGKLLMTVKKTDAGDFVYSLTTSDGKTVIADSAMGLTANNFAGFNGAVIKDATAKELNVS